MIFLYGFPQSRVPTDTFGCPKCHVITYIEISFYLKLLSVFDVSVVQRDPLIKNQTLNYFLGLESC